MTIIREAKIPYLVYLWILAGGYYALWEFGLLKKKGKTGSQKNKGGKNEWRIVRKDNCNNICSGASYYGFERYEKRQGIKDIE